MEHFTELMWASLIYPAIVDQLDYQSASRLSRTCRRLTHFWREFVVPNVSLRIARFYRGAALRAAAAANGDMSDIPPPVPTLFSDTDCIFESVRFGLPIDQIALTRLATTVDISSSLVTDELIATSRAFLRTPHLLPCTRAKSIVRVQQHAKWLVVPRHGRRVVCAVNEVLAAVGGDAALPSIEIARRARNGCVDAMPHVVLAYVKRFGGDAPRLPPELFGRDLRRAERATLANRVRVAAFRVFYAMAFTLFGHRVRSRARGAVAVTPTLPAVVDASDAWRFVVANGVTFRSAALDAIVNRSAYVLDLQCGAIEFESLRGKYLCAQRYLEAHSDLLPPPPSAARVGGGDRAWMHTILGNEYDDGLSALFDENTKYHMSTRLLDEPNQFSLPSIYIVRKGGFVVLSTAVERIRLATIGRRPLDNSFYIQWTPYALALRCDEPLRSCVLRFLQNAHTVRVEPVTRCAQCNRILVDRESVTRGTGPECAKRIKLSLY